MQEIPHISCDVSSMIALAALSALTPPSHSHAHTIPPSASPVWVPSLATPVSTIFTFPRAETPSFPSTSITAVNPGQAQPPASPVTILTHATSSIPSPSVTFMAVTTEARRSSQMEALRKTTCFCPFSFWRKHDLVRRAQLRAIIAIALLWISNSPRTIARRSWSVNKFLKYMQEHRQIHANVNPFGFTSFPYICHTASTCIPIKVACKCLRTDNVLQQILILVIFWDSKRNWPDVQLIIWKDGILQRRLLCGCQNYNCTKYNVTAILALYSL